MIINGYSSSDIVGFVEQNDVKFIRLAFCDIFGKMKNIAILPTQLKKAFKYGIPFDISAYLGKNYMIGHEIRLFPIENTLSLMPWRPKTGSVIRLLCDIRENDGTVFQMDQRYRLKEYLNTLLSKGYYCDTNTECEFYLFKRDDKGEPTTIPNDNANYLDTSPLDKCENIRREICIFLEEMGLCPESSRHKYGPGQNEIDFKHSDALSCADNFSQFRMAVKTIAYQNGLYCSFLPKPIQDKAGSSLLINLNIKKDGQNIFSMDSNDSMNPLGHQFIAGILDRLPEMSCFLNCNTNSYNRLNQIKLDRSMPNLIRIQALTNSNRIALCSPDAMCNIYSVLNLILHAGIEGIELHKDIDTIKCRTFADLPSSLEEALTIADSSEFVKCVVGKNTWKQLKTSLDEIVDLFNDAPDKQIFEEVIYTKYYG